jgi:polyferredoxin
MILYRTNKYKNTRLPYATLHRRIRVVRVVITRNKFSLLVLVMLVAFPLLAYAFGKRFYCSWVCGCGGLANTAGEPFRHLSSKSAKAWRIEPGVEETSALGANETPGVSAIIVIGELLPIPSDAVLTRILG